MKKQSMPYEAPELVQISVRVEKGFAVSSDIEPGTGGALGHPAVRFLQLDRAHFCVAQAAHGRSQYQSGPKDHGHTRRRFAACLLRISYLLQNVPPGSIPSFKTPFVLMPQSLGESRQLPASCASCTRSR